MRYVLLAASIFGLDTWLKGRMDKERKPGESVLGGRILLRRHYNKGAVLNSFDKWPCVVRLVCSIMWLALGIVFFVILRKPGRRGMKLGLSMVLGGGASNLYDRFRKGHVVDYFSFKCPLQSLEKIVFNVSDLFIFLGSALMLFGGGKKEAGEKCKAKECTGLESEA